jgi:hypothetical protein
LAIELAIGNSWWRRFNFTVFTVRDKLRSVNTLQA